MRSNQFLIIMMMLWLIEYRLSRSKLSFILIVLNCALAIVAFFIE